MADTAASTSGVSQQTGQNEASQKRGFFKRYQSEIILVGLTIYVIILGVATVDELFDLGIFPPELDKQISSHIAVLRDPSATPEAKKKADAALMDIGHFAIRQLIIELKHPDMKAKAADLLKRICAELDLEGQAQRTVERLGDRDPKERKKAAWELVEIGHWGLDAQIKGLGHIRDDIRRQLPRIVAQTASEYFGSNPWQFEKDEAKAKNIVSNLAAYSADQAASQLSPIKEAAIPVLMDGLLDMNETVRAKSAQVLAKLTGQKLGTELAKWQQWNEKRWHKWLEENKGKLGFGDDYERWKLWYRMNKDHL